MVESPTLEMNNFWDLEGETMSICSFCICQPILTSLGLLCMSYLVVPNPSHNQLPIQSQGIGAMQAHQPSRVEENLIQFLWQSVPKRRRLERKRKDMQNSKLIK
jgi:hypothetical protein